MPLVWGLANIPQALDHLFHQRLLAYLLAKGIPEIDLNCENKFIGGRGHFGSSIGSSSSGRVLFCVVCIEAQ